MIYFILWYLWIDIPPPAYIGYIQVTEPVLQPTIVHIRSVEPKEAALISSI